MSELWHLLTDWTHWAFEVISGGVFFAAGLAVPERYNPVKRLVTRHDATKHPHLWDDDEEATHRRQIAKHGVPDA